MFKRFTSLVTDAWAVYRRNPHFVTVAMVLQLLSGIALFAGQHAHELALPFMGVTLWAFLFGGMALAVVLELTALDVCRRSLNALPIEVPDACFWAATRSPRYAWMVAKLTAVLVPLLVVVVALSAGVAHLLAQPAWHEMWTVFGEGAEAHTPALQVMREMVALRGGNVAFAAMGTAFVAIWWLMLYASLTCLVGVMETTSLQRALRTSVARVRTGGVGVAALLVICNWMPIALDRLALRFSGDAGAAPFLAFGSVALAPMLALLRCMFYFRCLPKPASKQSAKAPSSDAPALRADVLEEELH